MVGRKLGNLFLLVFGYGVGQGAIFAAQTSLILKGDLISLSRFGVHFSFAILAMLVIDWGSLTILARNVVRTGNGASKAAVWQHYWEMTAVRLIVGMTVAAIAASSLAWIDDPFTLGYVVGALPAALLWPFNFGGLLDGLRRSGLSGLCSVPPYLLSALALVVVSNDDPHSAGLWLGTAITLGFALTVTAQFVLLVAIGETPRLASVEFRKVVLSMTDGAGALFGVLPGQIYYRIQLVLCGAFLGSGALAVFVYAKQVATGANQIVGMLIRVEFPDLVSRLEARRAGYVGTVFHAQMNCMLVALVAAVCAFVAGAIAYSSSDSSTSDAGFAITLFAPTILTGAVSLSLIQGLNALGYYRISSVTMIFCTSIAILLSYFAMKDLHLPALALGDVFLNILVVILSVLSLRRAEY